MAPGGQNVAESLTRGMRVIITGRLKQRSTRPRKARSGPSTSSRVDEVGPSLRNASAKVAKVARSGAVAAPRAGDRGSKQADPWAIDASPVATATSRRSSWPALPQAGTPALFGSGRVSCRAATPPDIAEAVGASIGSLASAAAAFRRGRFTTFIRSFVIHRRHYRRMNERMIGSWSMSVYDICHVRFP